jgi:catechol 2,3-dioxygenase-like lactoylglutathione lyase family enzyme
MSDFVNSVGLYHVGFGVRNLERSTKFYMETLGLSEMFEQFPGSTNSMADTFHNSAHCFDANMFHHSEGGLTLEPVFKHYPTPRPIFAKPQYGDIGPNKVTFAVANVEKFFNDYQGKVTFLGKPQATKIPGLGDYAFVFGRDPDGNIVEFASWDGAVAEGNLLGSVKILGVGVTNLERSKEFYQKHCGFDVVVSEHDKFSGLVGEASGSANAKVKSVLLDNSRASECPVGTAMLELYEVSDPSGRSVPFGTQWADFGFMELCLVCPGDVNELAMYYRDQGIEIVQRPTHLGNDEDNTVEYWFTYVRDPDGIFVETVGFRPIV